MAVFEVHHLSKHYKKTNALRDVSLHVESGEIVALIGQNGAGKTTLLNCIAGNIAPTKGRIQYKGANLLGSDSLLGEFGILIQANFFDYMNAYDNLVLLMQASGFRDKRQIQATVDKTLALVGLTEKRKAYVKSFSFGMKQRLGLAQALLHDPQFLILDEPFVGLDPIGKEMLKNTILRKAKEERAGVLFSSHDLFDVGEICDRIVMLDHGEKVFDGVFKHMRTFNIITGAPLSPAARQSLAGRFGGRISCGDNALVFAEADMLHEVVSTLTAAGGTIADVHITENSLYDYFKQEVA